jgi:hypothetical protein
MEEKSSSEYIKNQRNAGRLATAFKANQNCVQIVDNILDDAEILRDNLIDQTKRDVITPPSIKVANFRKNVPKTL